MKSDYKYNFRFKTSILLFGLVLSLFCFGFWSSYFNFNETEKSKQKNLETIGYSISHLIGQSFWNHYNSLKILSSNLNLTNLTQQELQNKLNREVNQHDNWDLLLVVDPQGNYISSSTFDQFGKTVDTNALRSQNYSNTIWHQSVINNHFSEDSEKKLTGVFVEVLTADPLLNRAYSSLRNASTFSAPIKNSTNQIIAVVTARVNSRWIMHPVQGFIEKITQSSSKESSLFAKDLNIALLNSSSNSIIEINSNQPSNFILDSYSYGLSQVSYDEESKQSNYNDNDETLTVTLSELNQHKTGLIKTEGSSEWQNFALIPVKTNSILPAINWKLLLRQSTQSIFNAKNEFGLITLLFIAILGISLIFGQIIISTSHGKELKEITDNLFQESRKLTNSKNIFENYNSHFSQVAQTHTSAIEAATKSISEVTDQIHHDVTMAEKASSHFEEISSLTEHTQKGMNELIQAMKSIQDSNQRIEALVKIIEEIGEKTEIIDDIVFKTQLLSFNASVEAERAGEHGRGFSVVAQEVGNLAQLSGKAATEIASIVKNSIKEANLVSKENKERVTVGEHLTKDTYKSISSVMQKLQIIFEITEKLGASSKEHGTGLSDVTKILGSITQHLSQKENSEILHSKNAQELEEQSKTFHFLIEKLEQFSKAS